MIHEYQMTHTMTAGPLPYIIKTEERWPVSNLLVHMLIGDTLLYPATEDEHSDVAEQIRRIERISDREFAIETRPEGVFVTCIT